MLLIICLLALPIAAIIFGMSWGIWEMLNQEDDDAIWETEE